MKKAIYHPMTFLRILGFKSVEVQLLGYETVGDGVRLARILFPTDAKSVLGIIWTQAGRPGTPPPQERLVMADQIEEIGGEA